MSENSLNIVMAQLNFLVGDIEGNTTRIINAANEARDKLNADLIIFPELAITSYPPEDLLLRPGLYLRVEEQIDRLLTLIRGIDVIVGYPELFEKHRYNSALLIRDGNIVARYRKQNLPNYSVFDEERYFTRDFNACIVDIKGVPTAITICEDLWFPEPMQQAKDEGAKLMISINSSPFDMNKAELRKLIMSERAIEGEMPLIYVNLVGGQDELIFDGGSMAITQEGHIPHHAPFFEEILEKVTLSLDPLQIISQKAVPEISMEERMYTALVLGVRDYINKNNFKRAVIGLSGGIDSALTLCIAADAIGPENLEGLTMPSRYTSQISIEDAEALAKNLNVECHNIPIDNIFQCFLDGLKGEFEGLKPDTTEENLQARTRGSILMAVSNKKNAIVLSTGNKSELSVGYATLYGDMVGGFCVLKDVPKTWVYKLTKYRNSIKKVIPERIITRPPSAELAPGQLDSDTLPPYDILDAILERYVEKDESLQVIISAGFNPKTVHQVAKMINHNEYKRHQAPIGPRITGKAFGRDRRYPITSKYYRDLPE